MKLSSDFAVSGILRQRILAKQKPARRMKPVRSQKKLSFSAMQRLGLGLVPAALTLSLFAAPLAATDPAFYEERTTAPIREYYKPVQSNYGFRSYRASKRVVGRHFPTPNLDPVNFKYQEDGTLLLNSNKLPGLDSKIGERLAAITPRNENVFYSISPELQDLAENLVRSAPAPHTSVVAMDPRTGRILAMANKSSSISDLSLHVGMPAASLFKVITAAAALENSNIQPSSQIFFRGGTYTLQPWNYKADRRRDRRWMTLADALGKSCNPVFARVAQKHLSPEVLHSYAERFGFNQKLPFELPLPMSTALIPRDSDYKFSRTAAGFGEVLISPVHAAALVSGVANQGLLPRPFLLDEVISQDGIILHRSSPEPLIRMVDPETATTLLDLMEETVTTGTSRREFMKSGKPRLAVQVVGKTGTLRGKNPGGINNWFIGTAPKENPEIAVAVVTVYPNRVSTRASRIARQLFEGYFSQQSL